MMSGQRNLSNIIIHALASKRDNGARENAGSTDAGVLMLNTEKREAMKKLI